MAYNSYYNTLLDWVQEVSELMRPLKPSRMSMVVFAMGYWGVVDRECLDAIHMLARQGEIDY